MLCSHHNRILKFTGPAAGVKPQSGKYLWAMECERCQASNDWLV